MQGQALPSRDSCLYHTAHAHFWCTMLRMRRRNKGKRHWASGVPDQLALSLVNSILDRPSGAGIQSCDKLLLVLRTARQAW